MIIKGNTESMPLLSLTEGEGQGEGDVKKTALARALRKSMTDTEKKMWTILRDRRFEGYKFRRQFPIGKYIADFACTKAKLVIELDSSQHMDNQYYDQARDLHIRNLGYRVLRFWNNDIFTNTDGVMNTIANTLRTLTTYNTLTPTFSLVEGEGGVAA